MSMFTISGVVLHLFDAPGRVDKQSGNIDEDKPKVQLLGEIPQRNGQVKYGLIDLTCRDPEDFRPFLKRHVSCPIGVFSAAKEKTIYFIPEGCKPSPVPGPAAGPGGA